MSPYRRPDRPGPPVLPSARFGVRDELAVIAAALVAGLSMMSPALLEGWTAAPSLGLVLVVCAAGRLVRTIVRVVRQRARRPRIAVSGMLGEPHVIVLRLDLDLAAHDPPR
jgi:hypothetical protein